MATTCCLRCRSALDVDGKPGPAASITGGLSGDAYTLIRRVLRIRNSRQFLATPEAQHR